MKIAISSESTIDLPKQLLEEFNITTIPYNITLGDQSEVDGEITPSQIFEFVKKTKQLPKTNAINDYSFEEYFSRLLKNNDAVIHFCLSSKMSVSYSNACRVAARLKNVYIVDTASLSTGIALFAIYASKLTKTGISPEKIVQAVKARIPHQQVSFVLDRLDYLYKGGRCNGLQFLFASLLKIKPLIAVTDGKMGVAKKYRGKNEEVVKSYCRDVLEKYNTPDKSIAFLTYTTATPEMIKAARTALETAGFEKIYETTAGGTISSHCGENTLGILYLNDGQK